MHNACHVILHVLVGGWGVRGGVGGWVSVSVGVGVVCHSVCVSVCESLILCVPTCLLFAHTSNCTYTNGSVF